jgi:hypothetical protein
VRRAKFRFRSDEAGSAFRCKLDRRKFRPCQSPRLYRKLKEGRHVFRVFAIDTAGNPDPTPAKRFFKLVQKEPKGDRRHKGGRRVR